MVVSMIHLLLISAGIIRTEGAGCSLLSPKYIISSSGSISSPGYPYYHMEEHCQWNIYPPAGNSMELMVTTITVDTNPESIHEVASEACSHVQDYVDFGGVRGCGYEPSPTCFVFNISKNAKCQEIIRQKYSHCHTWHYSTWPMKVSFVTSKPQEGHAGFQLNYTFIGCNTELDMAKLVADNSTRTTPTTSAVKSRQGMGGLSIPMISLAVVLAILICAIAALGLRRMSRLRKTSRSSTTTEITIDPSNNNKSKKVEDAKQPQILVIPKPEKYEQSLPGIGHNYCRM